MICSLRVSNLQLMFAVGKTLHRDVYPGRGRLPPVCFKFVEQAGGLGWITTVYFLSPAINKQTLGYVLTLAVGVQAMSVTFNLSQLIRF